MQEKRCVVIKPTLMKGSAVPLLFFLVSRKTAPKLTLALLAVSSLWVESTMRLGALTNETREACFPQLGATTWETLLLDTEGDYIPAASQDIHSPLGLDFVPSLSS